VTVTSIERAEWHLRTPDWVQRVLALCGREEREPPPIEQLGRVLITGAAGTVGEALSRVLLPLSFEERQPHVSSIAPTDVVAKHGVGHLDVLNGELLVSQFAMYRPDVVFHMAGAKHAPEGEMDPWNVLQVNAMGTRNVIQAAGTVGAKVVLASTCKACDPETAYGASKLIAERLVLNAKGVVVRYHNIVNSSGNVFEKWRSLYKHEPVEFTRCQRHFISLKEAVWLTAWAASQASGRYVLDPGVRVLMGDVAEALYPSREKKLIEMRRGDRAVEPLIAASESYVPARKGIWRVKSPHDMKEAG